MKIRDRGIRRARAHRPHLRMAALLAALMLAAVGGAAANPQTFNYRGTPLLTGGMSETDRQIIRDEAAPYNLWLAFVEEDTGKYVSGVKVSVVNQDDDAVVDTVADGPWLLAQLPPGQYRVRIGDGKEQPVTVSPTGQTLTVMQVGRQP